MCFPCIILFDNYFIPKLYQTGFRVVSIFRKFILTDITPILVLNTDLTLILRKKYNEKNGSMYILPESFAGIMQKSLNKDTKKSTQEHKTLTYQRI